MQLSLIIALVVFGCCIAYAVYLGEVKTKLSQDED
jgi:hypothetical protein